MQLTWDNICEDRSLQNLPYKIETNCYGQLILSHTSFWRSSRQGMICKILGKLGSQGSVSTETAVATSEGVKVADVAWSTRQFFKAHKNDSPLTEAPQVCVEVISDSNATQEIEEKIRLYLDHGAKEVWLCDDAGKMTFYISHQETASKSVMFPGFPSKV